jgi:hypothetical protein
MDIQASNDVDTWHKKDEICTSSRARIILIQPHNQNRTMRLLKGLRARGCEKGRSRATKF